VRSRFSDTPASIEMRRWTSCSVDISSENNATGSSLTIEALAATDSARLVFPSDGRPATMIRSASWNPAVMSSRSAKPVGAPVTASPRPARDSSCMTAP